MTNFLSLPRELRDSIYELCLLKKNPFDPWCPCDWDRRFAFGLFRVSKLIHNESVQLFYAHNQFDLSTHCGYSKDVASFLEVIGPNAIHIQHVLANFPQYRNLYPGSVTLEDQDVRVLANIQSNCANIITVTTSIQSTHIMKSGLLGLYPQVAREALELVDPHFRAISSSLQKITVKLYAPYGHGPRPGIRRLMRSHGWKITTTIMNLGDWEIGSPIDNCPYGCDNCEHLGDE